MENYELFENSEASIEVKLNNFPKYVSQRKIARFLTHYELFKMQLNVKGSIIAFDELANWDWPGETQALVQTLGVNNLEIRHFPWEPNVSYAIL